MENNRMGTECLFMKSCSELWATAFHVGSLNAISVLSDGVRLRQLHEGTAPAEGLLIGRASQ